MTPIQQVTEFIAGQLYQRELDLASARRDLRDGDLRRARGQFVNWQDEKMIKNSVASLEAEVAGFTELLVEFQGRLKP